LIPKLIMYRINAKKTKITLKINVKNGFYQSKMRDFESIRYIIFYM
jgi:hypothetical protein